MAYTATAAGASSKLPPLATQPHTSQSFSFRYGRIRAPVADTSGRLPPLAEQATIALQDPLPVAYSYGS